MTHTTAQPGRSSRAATARPTVTLTGVQPTGEARRTRGDESGVPGPARRVGVIDRSALGLPLMSTGAAFNYSPLLPTGADQTEYRLVTDEGVDVVEGPGGRRFLTVEQSALTQLTAEAMHDIAHYLRPAHLAQLRKIIDDPEASGNDRFVALDLLKNVNISAGGVLPMCQDTGTAIVMGKRGRHVLTDGGDAQERRVVPDVLHGGVDLVSDPRRELADRLEEFRRSQERRALDMRLPELS